MFRVGPTDADEVAPLAGHDAGAEVAWRAGIVLLLCAQPAAVDAREPSPSRMLTPPNGHVH